MITWVTTRRGRETIGRHLQSPWGRSLTSIARVASYASLVRQEAHPPGAYLLADVEGLNSTQVRAASLLHARLLAQGHVVLNDPLRTLRPYALLRGLFQLGRSQFNAHRWGAIDVPVRFPVQLRHSDDGRALDARLLENESQVRAAAQSWRGPRFGKRDALGQRRWWQAGLRDDQMLLVEHRDTADRQGVYRRYSALVIGDRILPHRLVLARHWTCRQEIIGQDYAAVEERAYVCANPHSDRLQRLCAFAGIEYGQIDYSVGDRQLHLWSVHTNPNLTPVDPRGRPQLALERSAERLTAALERLGMNLDHLARAA